MKKHTGIIAVAVLWLGFAQIAQAALFGTGENQFTMSFEDIGNVGNAASTNTGYGAVNYNYSIATYEVTIDQFIKVRAMDSNVGNGDENYWNDGTRTVGTNAPAVKISWFGAAGFCNWLTSGNALQGAYQFDVGGGLTNVMTREQILADGGVFYVLPTEDEWYKSAYYTDSGYSLYANGTGTAPGASDARYGNNNNDPWAVGGGAKEQNNTYDMMGNVWEWCENAYAETNRVLRGGAYNTAEGSLEAINRFYDNPNSPDINVGFRVVAIPEPAVVSLLVSSGLMLLGFRRFFDARRGV